METPVWGPRILWPYQHRIRMGVLKELCERHLFCSDSRHIVRYCGTDRGLKHLYIFLEYVPGGSIASMLQQFGVFREDLVRRFMHQVQKSEHKYLDKIVLHVFLGHLSVCLTNLDSDSFPCGFCE